MINSGRRSETIDYGSLEEWMAQQYDGSDDPRAMAEEFFVACAKAITSEQVMNELRQYTLAPDFEVSVFNPTIQGRERITATIDGWSVNV
jgi:hypothetical protein